MFLKKVTIKRNGKTYNYYKIVASYRDKDGKPKHRLVQNLGALSDEDAERMRQIIKAQQDPNLTLAKSSDIVVRKHWLFLPIVILHGLWKKFGLHRFFFHSLLTEALVLNRCIEPMSKIHIVEWMQETVLPALAQSPAETNHFAVYRVLDHLNQREYELQNHLARELAKQDPSMGKGVFYDMTSTYMEGSQCMLAHLGYSRDRRPDRQQIVIALMVTPNGSPFYWKVLAGNTQDITTLPGLVHELKQRFSLKQCHLVFDRGMVSKNNLALLEQEEFTYLSAMDKDEMANHPLFNQVMPEPASKDNYEQIMSLHGFEPVDENGLIYVREEQIEDRRYIFSFDVTRFQEDIHSRSKRVAQVIDWTKAENEKLSAAKKSRRKETLERKVAQILSKRKVKSFMKVDIIPLQIEVPKKDGSTRIVQSFQLTTSIDEGKEREIRKKDGLTCFITNNPSIPKLDVVRKYREKNRIEEAFREIKSQLALRPIHLTRPERVKAHVSICALAYLLMNTMEMMLRQKGIQVSASHVIRQMNRCQLNEVGFKGSPNTSITMTELTEQQQKWVKCLGFTNELKPARVKKITEKLKKGM